MVSSRPKLVAIASLSLALFVPTAPPQSQEPVARHDMPDSVTIGSRFTLHSAVLGEDREVSVHLPATYGTERRAYPVLYVLDGEQIFVPLVGVAQALEWAFRAPALIVVGIHNTNRTRDLTTPWTSAAPKGMYETAAARSGGADRFLSFLQTELIPEIDRRYRTTRFRILFGHSFGGLFALHALTQSPGLFTATIASSPPAFWNGNEEIDHLTRLFARSPPVSGYLFVSAAAKEFDDTPRAVGTIEELVRLRDPATLHALVRTIPGTDHGTVLLGAAQSGLELAFVGWRLPQLVFEEGLDSIDAYYRQRSTEYGFPVVIPEGEISALGLRLETRDPPSATEAFRRYTQLYPTSIAAWCGLGETEQAIGATTTARSAYERVLKLTASSRGAPLGDLKAKCDSLTSR